MTFAELEARLRKIGLPIKVAGRQRWGWEATIEYSCPDYSTGRALGHGDTIEAAIVACLNDYEQQKGT